MTYEIPQDSKSTVLKNWNYMSDSSFTSTVVTRPETTVQMQTLALIICMQTESVGGGVKVSVSRYFVPTLKKEVNLNKQAHF